MERMKNKKLKNLPKANKITLLVLILLFAIAGYVIIQSQAAETIPHPDGTLVKINDEPGDPEKENIYQIRDGKLYLFPSTKNKNSSGTITYSDPILNSYGYNRSKAKTPTDKDKQLPKSVNNQTLQLTYREGTLLFDDQSYWLVDEDTTTPLPKVTRHKIVDPLKYGNALGYNLFTWQYDIVRISANEISKVGTLGSDVTTYDKHADGSIIRSNNIFYLIKNGQRYRIPNTQVAQSHGYNVSDISTWAKVKSATPADIKLPESGTLSYREGSILRCNVDFQPTGAAQKCAKGKLYIVDDKNTTPVKREFIGNAYQGLGYTDLEVISLDTSVAPDVPNTDQNNPVIFSGGIIIPQPIELPKAIITSPTSTTNITTTSKISFSANGSTVRPGGKIVTYTWNFGDGTSGTGAAASHSYAKAGDYIVTLTIIDDKGLSSSSTVTIKVKTTDVGYTPSNVKKVGYTVYDSQAAWKINRDAIRRQKPSMVRWILSLDRHVRNENETFDLKSFSFINKPRDFDAVLINNADYIDFLKALKESNTTLVVGNWLKTAKSWYYPEYSACSGCRYPDIAKYSAYMKKVETMIKAQGVDTIWEPWNEPDLRWGVLTSAMPKAGASENFSTPWTPNLSNGYGTWWTAGTGELWKQMHYITSFPQASAGIVSRYVSDKNVNPVPPNYVESTKWREATAPHIRYFSLHLYRNNYEGGYATTAVADYVDRAADEMAQWNKIKGSPMQFYIGEIGPSSGTNFGFSDVEAKYMRDVHEALSQDSRTKNAYMGMIAHVFGDGGVKEVDAWETRKGWWQPDYSASDIVEESPR